MADELLQLELAVDRNLRMLAPLRAADARLAAPTLHSVRAAALAENQRLLRRRRFHGVLRGLTAAAAAVMLALGLQSGVRPDDSSALAATDELDALSDWNAALGESDLQFTALFSEDLEVESDADPGDLDPDEVNWAPGAPQRGGA